MQNTKLTFHDLDITWLANAKLQISQKRTTIEEAAKSAKFIKDEQIIQKPISRQTLSKAFTSRSEEIKQHAPGAFEQIQKGSLPYIKLMNTIIDTYKDDSCGITNMWQMVNETEISNEIGYISRPIVANIYDQLGLTMTPIVKPNKLRFRYEVNMPNAIWHGDIHEITLDSEKLPLFALLDDYSRFIVAWKILPDKTSSSVRDVFIDAINEFGKPLTYWSDNGPENRGELQSFLDDQNIVHFFTKPYNPQANGLKIVQPLMK